jgi:hypothetical protein
VIARSPAASRDCDDGHGHVLLLYPPEQVQAVHDAFDRDDVVDGVEREVSAKTRSIRGHVLEVTQIKTRQGTSFHSGRRHYAWRKKYS